VVEFSGTTRHNLGGPGGVTKVSASVDPATGCGEVFALTYAGALWVCDSYGHWSNPFPGRYEYISATRDGHVYAVTADLSAAEYFNANGVGTNLGAPPSGVLQGDGEQGWPAIAATVNAIGVNEVYVVGENGVLYVDQGNSPRGWQVVDNHATFVGVAA